MGQPLPEQPKNQEPLEVEPMERERGRAIPLVVFAITSLLFLLYVALGTIEARIWRFGRLTFEDRTIRHVWSYFGDRLPQLPGQAMITGLYWTALAVMVVGTVVGLWLFLGTPDDDPAQDARTPGAEQPANHG